MTIMTIVIVPGEDGFAHVVCQIVRPDLDVLLFVIHNLIKYVDTKDE